MAHLIVKPEHIEFLLAIESKRLGWVDPSWILTTCTTCGRPAALRTPHASHSGVVSWLCTTCGYFDIPQSAEPS